MRGLFDKLEKASGKAAGKKASLSIRPTRRLDKKAGGCRGLPRPRVADDEDEDEDEDDEDEDDDDF